MAEPSFFALLTIRLSPIDLFHDRKNEVRLRASLLFRRFANAPDALQYRLPMTIAPPQAKEQQTRRFRDRRNGGRPVVKNPIML